MTPPNDPAGPIRTCVGCRAKRPQAELVRCVLDADGRARVDRHGPGRGAWLCGPACLEPARRRNAFERAWRRSGRLPAGTFEQLADELAGTRADERLADELAGARADERLADELAGAPPDPELPGPN